MFLKIENNISEIYNININYFQAYYQKTIKSKESIVARYLISMYIDEYYNIKSYYPKIDENWKPIFDLDNLYWSISHKDNLVFVWVSNEKIWVDIEIYKDRDLSLLDTFSIDEYNILWWKTWTNFYILWTAKESFIKSMLFELKEMDEIKLVNKKDINKELNNLNFSMELLLDFNWINNQVYFWRIDDINYSICSDNMLE